MGFKVCNAVVSLQVAMIHKIPCSFSVFWGLKIDFHCSIDTWLIWNHRIWGYLEDARLGSR